MVYRILENLLFNTNQLRHYGLEVQDNPWHQDPMVIQKNDDEEFFGLFGAGVYRQFYW